MTEEDIPAGMGLCRAAGWNQLEEDWRVFLRAPGSGAFVVESGHHVLGTVAWLRHGSFGWIAMMLVDPGERRSGNGSRLMEAVLSAVSDAETVGLDATPLGEPLYRRYGLVNRSHLVRAKAIVRARHFRASARVHRMTNQDLEHVLQRDQEIFGADRSHLLTSLHARCPEAAWVLGDAYCFGRPGRLYHQLGPVAAGDREAAMELVAHCLSHFDGKRFAIDVPVRDAEWQAWLTGHGFEEERPFVRMFREGDHEPGEPGRQFAIAGPEYA